MRCNCIWMDGGLHNACWASWVEGAQAINLISFWDYLIVQLRYTSQTFKGPNKAFETSDK